MVVSLVAAQIVVTLVLTAMLARRPTPTQPGPLVTPLGEMNPAANA